MSIFVEPRQPSALELFSQSFGPSFAKGQQQKQQMLQQLALQKAKQQQQATPFQKMSTELRERELKGKAEKVITDELLKLSTQEMGSVITGKDVPYLSSKTMSLVERGMNPQLALSTTLNEFQGQKDTLLEATFPKYNQKKKEKLINEVSSYLNDEQINNPHLINEQLRTNKYPQKVRQDILRSLRKPMPTTSIDSTSKIKFNPSNSQHINRRDQILRQVGNDKAKANQILGKEFE